MRQSRTLDELIAHLMENSTVDEETNCLLWQGACTDQGYGTVSWQGKQVSIHRWAYKIEHPDEVVDVVMHTCDVKNCWRLEHLVNGSYKDNTTDAVNKGIQARGSRIGISVLNETQVAEIKASPLSSSYLAKQYGVSYRNIWAIKTGRMWKHVS